MGRSAAASARLAAAAVANPSMPWMGGRACVPRAEGPRKKAKKRGWVQNAGSTVGRGGLTSKGEEVYVHMVFCPLGGHASREWRGFRGWRSQAAARSTQASNTPARLGRRGKGTRRVGQAAHKTQGRAWAPLCRAQCSQEEQRGTGVLWEGTVCSIVVPAGTRGVGWGAPLRDRGLRGQSSEGSRVRPRNGGSPGQAGQMAMPALARAGWHNGGATRAPTPSCSAWSGNGAAWRHHD